MTKSFSACFLVLSLAASAVLSGCNIVGPAAVLFSDPKIQAQHELDPEKTAVVFIDDRSSVMPSRSLRVRLAKSTEKSLLEAKVLEADVISSDALMVASSSERFAKPKSITELGQAVGADVVIYASVDQFAISADGVQNTPTCIMRVKVLDVKDPTLRWPPQEGEAYTLTVQPADRPTSVPRSLADRAIEEQVLAEESGRRLAQLFFKHKARDPNPRIGGSSNVGGGNFDAGGGVTGSGGVN